MDPSTLKELVEQLRSLVSDLMEENKRCQETIKEYQAKITQLQKHVPDSHEELRHIDKDHETKINQLFAELGVCSKQYGSIQTTNVPEMICDMLQCVKEQINTERIKIMHSIDAIKKSVDH
jgi:predicted RNase H-like nuclease (RuvC/YqgF family)